MLWVIRIGLILGAVLVIKPAGRILSILLVADLSQPGLLAEVGMIVIFLVGFLALVVSGLDRLFGSSWLATLAVVGFGAVGVTRLGVSCSEVTSADLDYAAYYCGSPLMTWGVVGICATFLLIVVLRKVGILPTPGLSG